MSSSNSSRAVFLDRDGVIVRAIVRSGKPYPPASMDEVQIMPDANEALDVLANAGFLLIVVTNQPDVARGMQSRAQVEAIHSFLKTKLPLDQIMTCYHDDPDQCTCRKPQPGLIHEAGEMYGIDLPRSFMIGDRWRDIEAGRRAGCHTVFINNGYSERQPDTPDFEVRSLSEASEAIINFIKRGIDL